MEVSPVVCPRACPSAKHPAFFFPFRIRLAALSKHIRKMLGLSWGYKPLTGGNARMHTANKQPRSQTR